MKKAAEIIELFEDLLEEKNILIPETSAMLNFSERSSRNG